jgi:hypothetical protein
VSRHFVQTLSGHDPTPAKRDFKCHFVAVGRKRRKLWDLNLMRQRERKIFSGQRVFIMPLSWQLNFRGASGKLRRLHRKLANAFMQMKPYNRLRVKSMLKLLSPHGRPAFSLLEPDQPSGLDDIVASLFFLFS